MEIAKRAFISVWDKENILDTAKNLIEKNYEIVSTGGTFNYLKENGIKTTEISEITGFEEMLSGKVKSLHPAIFAGILAGNPNEIDEIQAKGFSKFDVIIVNLYPFEEISKNTDNIDELVKNIDIGGVALLRAGAKNFQNVTVICDKSDYNLDFDKIDLKTKEVLALKAFSLTSKYDAIIHEKLNQVFDKKPIKNFSFINGKKLRYGENPHQKAELYDFDNKIDYEILWGKEISYNNILDITSAVNIASEFYDVATCVIVKHTTPCGVAIGLNSPDALQKALDCDPISAFGGIIAFTQKVDADCAKIINSMFLEVIIAPDFSEEALKILQEKKNIRLVKLNTSLEDYKKLSYSEIRVTPFGILIQEHDTKDLDKDTFKVLTKTKPTPEQIQDAIFAWKIVKHAKSNAIVVAKDLKTLGIGQGQTSRINSVEIALNQACDEAKDAVLASDGFFPAIDNIQAAVQCRIGLIIQPAGSIKDKEVIACADKYNLPMIATGIRHFKH